MKQSSRIVSLLAEISNAELERQYDELEKKQKVSGAAGPDLEQSYGKDIRDIVPDDAVYGKNHRPGIDFIKDPAHAKHPMDKVATKLGYKYASSHLVQGKPFHIYQHPMHAVGAKNLALTTSKTGQPSWSFNQFGGSNAADLENKVKSHFQYIRKKSQLKRVPGITA